MLQVGFVFFSIIFSTFFLLLGIFQLYFANVLYQCSHKECTKYFRGYQYSDFFSWQGSENHLDYTIKCPNCYKAMKPEITKEHKWMKKAPDFKKINPLEYIVFLFRISKESQQVKKEMKVFKSRKEELENIITYKTYYAQNKRPSNVDPILLDTDWKLVQIELITDLHTFKKQTMSYKMEQEAINIIEELEKY